MTDQHPLEKARITRDRDETGDYLIIHDASPNHPAKPDSSLVERVAQWGYDQRGEVNEAKLQQARDEELEACCEWLEQQRQRNYPTPGLPSALRAARRPKPQTLTSIALQMLGTIERDAHYLPEITDTIRRALEALPDD